MSFKKCIGRINHHLGFWLLVLCTLVFSSLLYINLSSKPIINDSENQALITEIHELRAKLPDTPNPLETVPQVATSSISTYYGRVELTNELVRDKTGLALCGDPISSVEPANTFVRYTDQYSGISIEVPYNKGWGYEHCYLSAVGRNGESALSGGFNFGDLTNPETGERQYTLVALPKTSDPELNVELASYNENTAGTTTKRVINGLDVFDYQVSDSPIPTHSWNSVDKNYTYHITVSAKNGEDLNAIDAEAVKVIKSIQVLK